MGFGNKSNLPWWRSKYVLWAFIMLPGLLFTIGLLNGRMKYESLMHATGEFSGRFLVFSLIATPLVMMMPKYKFPKWLNRNKRYFGVAAFTYGLYHTIAYLVAVPTNQVLGEFFEIGLLTGWIAFIIWIPMAITSTDGWVKQLKVRWKKIHNWGYLAALFVFLHWAFIHYQWKPALVHAAPILLLQGYRWWKVFFTKKSATN
ncbi:MAG: sulfoxide reductase heme-binding subunit YedZ [Ulvibacter sp.]|jgi:sulfoxide reductase heme-binding subunit YedZ